MRNFWCLLGLHDWQITKSPEEDGFILHFWDPAGKEYEYVAPIGRLFKSWNDTVNDLSDMVCLKCEKSYEGYSLGIDLAKWEVEKGERWRAREKARQARAQEILAKRAGK